MFLSNGFVSFVCQMMRIPCVWTLLLHYFQARKLIPSKQIEATNQILTKILLKCIDSETQRPFKRRMKFFKTIKLKSNKCNVAIRLRQNIYNDSALAGSIVSILDLFLFDSCLQISEWECVKQAGFIFNARVYLESKLLFVFKLRHRFLICINICSDLFLMFSLQRFFFCLNHFVNSELNHILMCLLICSSALASLAI